MVTYAEAVVRVNAVHLRYAGLSEQLGRRFTKRTISYDEFAKRSRRLTSRMDREVRRIRMG